MGEQNVDASKYDKTRQEGKFLSECSTAQFIDHHIIEEIFKLADGRVKRDGIKSILSKKTRRIS